MEKLKHPSRLLNFVFAAFILAGSLSTASANAPLCSALFRASGATVTEPLFDEVARLNDTLTARLREDSSKLQTQFKNTEEGPVIDTLVMGAGLHGSIFSASAKFANPNNSVLVLEGGDVISSVFGNLQRTFRINSPEPSGQSANQFPNSPLAMKDLTSDLFPNSLHMSTLATATQYAAGVPTLFKQKVVSVTDLKGHPQAKARYMIQTDRGLKAYANKLVIATGLGTTTLPIKDVASLEMLKKEMAQTHPETGRLGRVMTVDDFLTIVSSGIRNKKDFYRETDGKVFAVIGQGDGGKIAIEAITNTCPSICEAAKATGRPVFADTLKVTWVGQRAQTPAEYRDSTWERYYDIAEQFGTKIRPIPDYASSVRKLPDGRYEIFCEKTNTLVIADYLVFATGYRHQYLETLAHLLGSRALSPQEFELRPITAQIMPTGPETVVGKRIGIVGAPVEQDIYVVGPAAGPLASEGELKTSITENPVSVEVLGPRTAAVAKMIVKPLAGSSRSVTLTRDANGLVRGRVVLPETHLRLSAGALRLVLKTDLVRALNQVGLAGESFTLRLGVNKGSASTAQVSVSGLSPNSGRDLLALLQKNKNLLTTLGEILSAQGPIQISVPVHQGRVQGQNIDIHQVK